MQQLLDIDFYICYTSTNIIIAFLIQSVLSLRPYTYFLSFHFVFFLFLFPWPLSWNYLLSDKMKIFTIFIFSDGNNLLFSKVF